MYTFLHFFLHIHYTLHFKLSHIQSLTYIYTKLNTFTHAWEITALHNIIKDTNYYKFGIQIISQFTYPLTGYQLANNIIDNYG